MPQTRTSYPYLTIARKYKVDYGDVLRFVDVYERYRSLEDPPHSRPVVVRSGLPANVMSALKGAVKREYEERAAVLKADRAYEERKRADFEEASEPPGCAAFEDAEEGDF